ncbi:MAG: hypothetical protein KJ935_07660 [Candidatus Omnitrophica bacterium]|nr:hypothetical protein [Candidatus Omnitrophota bacterium]
MVPQLQIRPKNFFKGYPKVSHSAVVYEIVNYSNFPAFNVESDMKFNKNDWIKNWSITRAKQLEKKGNNRTLQEDDEMKMRKTASAPHDKLEPGEYIQKIIDGSCPQNVCDLAKSQNGFHIYLKIVWYSEKKQKFEQVKKYSLLCAKLEETEEFSFLSSEAVPIP